MSAPSGKWGWGRSAKCVTFCGKVDMIRIVSAQEAAPKPAQAHLFATSTGAVFSFDTEVERAGVWAKIHIESYLPFRVFHVFL